MLKFSSNAKKVFNKLQSNLEMAQVEVRREMGGIAIRHYKKSFEREGFNNVPFMHWKLLKRPRTKYANRRILTRSGRLKNSLKYRTRIGKKTYSVSVFSDLEYAAVHNEGLMSGRGNGFKMPKRRFIGYSKLLEKKLATRLLNKLKPYLK
jgi:phage gpG-like protein